MYDIQKEQAQKYTEMWEEEELPVTASWAIQKYGLFLNEYEKNEILKYRDVPFL